PPHLTAWRFCPWQPNHPDTPTALCEIVDPRAESALARGGAGHPRRRRSPSRVVLDTLNQPISHVSCRRNTAADVPLLDAATIAAVPAPANRSWRRIGSQALEDRGMLHFPDRWPLPLALGIGMAWSLAAGLSARGQAPNSAENPFDANVKVSSSPEA